MENHEQVDYTVCNTKYLMFQVQPVQHVYPSQVQYVEGGDAVYTNGALYVVFPALRRVLTEKEPQATPGTFLHDSPTFFLLGMCLHKSLPLILWVQCWSHYCGIRSSQSCGDFRNHTLL